MKIVPGLCHGIQKNITIVHSHGAYDILQATHLQEGVSLCNLNIIMSFALAVVPACGWLKAVAS